jgi:predicted adenylyl cyclase CyaB
MIEIEKNFDLREGEKEKLIENATLIGKKEFTDVYYDDANLSLSLKDYWLRTRDGKWELKIPLNKDKEVDRKTDQYRELETDEEIAKELDCGATNLANELVSKGFAPLATITTVRESYSRGEFHIDFDEMDFGYSTCEIEYMVEDISQIKMAEDKIIALATGLGLSDKKGRGKLTVFLERFKNPEYKKLVEAGIIVER